MRGVTLGRTLWEYVGTGRGRTRSQSWSDRSVSERELSPATPESARENRTYTWIVRTSVAHAAFDSSKLRSLRQVRQDAHKSERGEP